MKGFFNQVTIWLTIICALAVGLANSCGPWPRNKLVCYAELWAGNRPSPANYDLDDLPPNVCDYVVLMFMTLDANTWGLQFHTGYGELDPAELRKALRLKAESPRTKLLLAVGGWEDGVTKYSDMISEPLRREAFINSAIEVLQKYELDGLELHWLYPGQVWRGGRHGDKSNFIRLLREMSKKFKPKNLLLTASVPADAETVNAGYEVSRLNSYTHQLHLRVFDLRGEWNKYATSHSPLFSSSIEKPRLKNLNLNGSLSLWLDKGASPHKLVPTFPFYGRTFTLKDRRNTDPGSPISGAGKWSPLLQAPGLLAYFEICDRIQNGRMTEYLQSGAETPYAVGDDQWVGYEDEKSLQKKIKFLADKNICSAGVYTIGMDDFWGVCGQSNFLLEQIKGHLNRGGKNENESLD